MGPVVFSTPELEWLDRLPAQVSALPCSTPPYPAWPVLLGERALLPGCWTKGARLRYQQVRAWELGVGGGQG